MSHLAPRTQACRARCVRRFLGWLPGTTHDTDAVLTQPGAWAQAAAQFITTLPACAGTPGFPGLPSTSGQFHADALADCARHLGLAPAYQSLPARHRWIHDRYTTTLEQAHLAPATAGSYLAIVAAFLRWLARTEPAADLRRQWPTATSAYLEHLARTGRAATTLRRRRTVLRDCATRLRLRTRTAPAQPPTPHELAAAPADHPPQPIGTERATPGTPSSPTRCWTLPLPATPSMVPVARAFIRAFMNSHPCADDTELITCEYLTNAVRHATPAPGGVIHLTVTTTAGTARVEVTSPSHATATPAPRDPGQDDENGRGLLIVTALATRCGHHRACDGQLTAWAELHTPPPATSNGDHAPAQP
jgi:anti-sigma regulatory factor (Ser/Thr protein kinase)